MQRFLNVYWVIYLAVYVIAVGFLMWLYWGELRRGDGLTRVYLLAAIFGTAAGGASVFALILEGGGRLVLLIPAAVNKIKDMGRKERDQRQAEALERFGYYDANGVRAMSYTDEVRRFLAGEDVGPDESVNRRPPFRRNRKNRRPR